MTRSCKLCVWKFGVEIAESMGSQSCFMPSESARRPRCGSRGRSRLPSPSSKVNAGHDDILDGLRSLGLTTATLPQVTAAVNELFPEGVENVPVGKCFGPFSFGSSVRIGLIMWGDNSHYQPSKRVSMSKLCLIRGDKR